jgi:hypothetical protein
MAYQKNQFLLHNSFTLNYNYLQLATLFLLSSIPSSPSPSSLINHFAFLHPLFSKKWLPPSIHPLPISPFLFSFPKTFFVLPANDPPSPPLQLSQQSASGQCHLSSIFIHSSSILLPLGHQYLSQ